MGARKAGLENKEILSQLLFQPELKQPWETDSKYFILKNTLKLHWIHSKTKPVGGAVTNPPADFAAPASPWTLQNSHS